MTERQLLEAEGEIKKAMDELVKNGGMELLISVGQKKVAQMFDKKNKVMLMNAMKRRLLIRSML